MVFIQFSEAPKSYSWPPSPVSGLVLARIPASRIQLLAYTASPKADDHRRTLVTAAALRKAILFQGLGKADRMKISVDFLQSCPVSA